MLCSTGFRLSPTPNFRLTILASRTRYRRDRDAPPRRCKLHARATRAWAISTAMEQKSRSDSPNAPDPRVSRVTVAQSACYRIHDLVIDVGRARVTRDDAEVALPKLSFDLLLALVDGAPNLVSLDSLMERVWPGLVVSPETVSQRVKLLRTALGDDPKQPRYIVAVRGRGYRLLPKVSRIDPSSCETLTPTSASVPATSAAPDDRRDSQRVRLAVVIVVLLAVGVVIALWRIPRDAPTSAQQSDTPAQAAPLRSVAVLPFESLSREPNDALLAIGIAEAVLHQLSNLNDLSVIARTSSFAVGDRSEDARAVGRRLNARYLLEGSVQNDNSRLRVTAQLIDSETGSHVWSIRFDRTPEDIFAVQDEIATQVARALASSVADKAGKQLAHGTENFDAWLPYLQGRALLATRRLADLEHAQGRFAEAIRVDPSFVSAYVSLAETHLLRSYFLLSEFWFINGPNLPEQERARIENLLEHALALDDKNGEAYLLRGWLEPDRAKAEGDYRRGLALSPNNALGYERLARLLFLFPDAKGRPDAAKRAEAYLMIDRARALDPLVPSGHLTKGLMMLYGRSDKKAANTLILQALEQDPNYYPALMRLAELRGCCEGEFAEAIRYGERALALEPNASWPQRLLLHFYLDIGELDAAKQVLEESRERDPVGQIPLLLYERAWKKAGELAFESEGPLSGIDREATVWAVSQYAQETGERVRSREFLEYCAVIDWSGQGDPSIDDITHDMAASVALAGILLAEGDAKRGRLLLRAVLHAIAREAQVRGDMWYGRTRPQALALLGETDAAIEALRKSIDTGSMSGWRYRLESERAYDALRRDPRFVALLEQVRNHVAAQRVQLDAMRVAGVVPTRAPRTARASNMN
jgi:transcriptional activator of cad operon